MLRSEARRASVRARRCLRAAAAAAASVSPSRHSSVDPVTSLDHHSVITSTLPHGGDYDGDGVANGVQTEVTGLLTNLVNKMLSTGLTIGSGGSHWTSYTNRTTFPVIYAAQRNAAWNEFLIERELSAGVHNTAFTVRLLQWSYTVLSTNTRRKFVPS